MADCSALLDQIDHLFELSRDELRQHGEARDVFAAFVAALEAGEVRAAQKSDDGRWQANLSVKRGILVGFRLGDNEALPSVGPLSFADKATWPTLTPDFEGRNIRFVPGGSSARAGCYLGRNVTCMPPMYINVGAWVDDDTMVDSHALVGSCAQIGKRVHLSAAVQVGGVLEPIGQVPVVVEDDVMVGGNAGIYEGTIVRTRAVIGTGTILNASTKVYDIVNERVLCASSDQPLEIPEGAVVVPGSRPARGNWAQEHGLSIYTPLIIKYRDDATDARTALEDALR